MHALGVSFESGEASVLASPEHDAERILAACGAHWFTGGLVVVEGLPIRMGEAIEDGDIRAFHDCIRPEDEFGFHRVVMGGAHLRQIDKVSVKHDIADLVTIYLPERGITYPGIYETVPEPMRNN